MACSMVSGERFSHLTMTTTAKGYKGHYVCMDREACMQRQLSGGGANDGASAQAGVPRASSVTHRYDVPTIATLWGMVGGLSRV
eukprot:6739999-Prymnesium_polylepis.1